MTDPSGASPGPGFCPHPLTTPKPELTLQSDHAEKAASRIREEYPGQRLYVMDTRCISGGLGTLVEKWLRLRKQARAMTK